MGHLQLTHAAPTASSPGSVASWGPAPGGGITGPWGSRCSCPLAVTLLVAMEQLALVTTGTCTPAGKVGAQQCVFLLALGKQA